MNDYQNNTAVSLRGVKRRSNLNQSRGRDCHGLLCSPRNDSFAVSFENLNILFLRLFRISIFDIRIYITLVCLGLGGCAEMSGYSDESLFPKDVDSVYVKMFDNRSYRRGVEYELTDALAKRIEAGTPYKIISSLDRADTVISGQIVQVTEAVLSSERQTGRVLEGEVQLRAVVNWKNLKTGELLIDNRSVSAAASYSQWQNQGFNYASTLAANNLARRIVELMEKEW
ncbi:MAG TPA: hypothetical protein ENH34_08135 [Phycisphaerales bacterium]|nr:hypothetical protein [Phycisphaerales bacterium]